MSNPIIFCDFDGTITNKDNIINIMKEFAPPEWVGIKDDILAQKVSIQEGVGKMFSLLPSSKKEEIISFVQKDAVIREGFAQFVQFTREANIPLYIVSGGIDFFVHPVLEPFGPFEKVYCNEADFSGENIQIVFPHECDDDCTNKGCGCCKPSIIRTIASEEHSSIVIGDSITDLEAAKLADVVIARDFLIEKCKELNIPFEPFERFQDCIRIIQSRMDVKV
ncbi:2-hydroxy-3-keto-5-methylthiopentenyl-1-phosphate phosphatase [Bacillus sp. S/N-304-OC-R1]|uniref:2-hydroxy-3-keto-5-methylthiopentenyl-1- phosphate phosphatase n=1 Tax=Bacillus sp. S/N-304-OC-R1 TaxID=2758034 RepID=UPI001C8EB1D9|nr:2-hydroxy-3-keto-5-methylthiopentenyl-1-phosphate phosphatase [Bacillus sp. S/N-304-OC-R1]MBY0121289.1 2-hydroxy-3-keto-5-methylthiopentenyl-1-phosphate phosphatase [Bacillus sp. S/N-304-OC-R1]